MKTRTLGMINRRIVEQLTSSVWPDNIGPYRFDRERHSRVEMVFGS